MTYVTLESTRGGLLCDMPVVGSNRRSSSFPQQERGVPWLMGSAPFSGYVLQA